VRKPRLGGSDSREVRLRGRLTDLCWSDGEKRCIGGDLYWKSVGGRPGDVMVPSDTYDDLGLYEAGAGAVSVDGGDIVACNSGVLDMICCALLIELVDGLAWADGAVAERGAEAANALSASFSVTLWLRSFGFEAVGGEVLSNSNLEPFSWRRENWSKLGNFEAISSCAGADFASRAANGSLFVTRIGDAVGFGPGA
jgi:hypothetical protein